MGAMARFEEPAAGADGWTGWVQPVRRGYKLACCDCGLVHSMRFRLVKNPRGRGLKIQFRARRNERSTALMRRWRKRKKRR